MSIAARSETLGRSVAAVFAVVFIWSLMMPVSVEAARRALVIGNAAYEEGLALANPTNDAEDVGAALKEVGFEVKVVKNLNLEEMEDALLGFRRSLQEGDVAFFFYAGHGLEVDGLNYLVPIGARIREAFEVKRQALDVAVVVEAMKESGAKLNVMVLDCCRDNPLKRSWATRSGGNRGLASLTAPEGTLVAYSTAPGQVASDGAPGKRNSPYSSALVKALKERPKQGLELKEVFFSASREVKKSTGQTPWVSLEASLDHYYLLPASEAVAEENQEERMPSEAPESVPSVAANLPESGFFGIDGLFEDSSYSAFRRWGKEQLLREVQEKLKEAGHYRSVIDGKAGPGTHAAILAFQEAKGFAATGKLDDPSLKAMGMEGRKEARAPAASSSRENRPSGSNRPKPAGRELTPEERVRRAVGLD